MHEPGSMCCLSGKLDVKLNWRIPLDEEKPEGKFVERSDTQNFIQVCKPLDLLPSILFTICMCIVNLLDAFGCRSLRGQIVLFLLGPTSEACIFTGCAIN